MAEAYAWGHDMLVRMNRRRLHSHHTAELKLRPVSEPVTGNVRTRASGWKIGNACERRGVRVKGNQASDRSR
eukprot:3315039-Pleurochrysis_carterae.AAC.1